MILGVLGILAVLGTPGTVRAAQAEGPAAVGERQPIARVWLRGEGLDAQALTGAVRARLHGKQVLGPGQSAEQDAGLAALCLVRWDARAAALRLEVILGDGRVYERKIAAKAGGRERTAARLVASTLAAIEDASATPDRRDGVFITPDTTATPAEDPTDGSVPAPPGSVDKRGVSPDASRVPAPGSVDKRGVSPEASRVPAPGSPDPAAASRVPAPPGSSDVSPASRVPGERGATPAIAVDGDVEAMTRDVPAVAAIVEGPRVRARSGRRSPIEPGPLELGVAIDFGAAFGLGLPAAGLGLAGGGGGLRVDLRLRRGAALGAGFRGIANGRDALTIGRFRGLLVAGYMWRYKALELAALAGPTLETWQVTQRGAPVAYAASGPGGASVLLGGLVRLALGARVLRRKRVALRAGGYVELAGSSRTSGRAAQVAREGEGGAPVTVFVLGGAELSVGAELELWFTLRRRS